MTPFSDVAGGTLSPEEQLAEPGIISEVLPELSLKEPFFDRTIKMICSFSDAEHHAFVDGMRQVLAAVDPTGSHDPQKGMQAVIEARDEKILNTIEQALLLGQDLPESTRQDLRKMSDSLVDKNAVIYKAQADDDYFALRRGVAIIRGECSNDKSSPER